LKVALVHDWFVGGGAERVVYELHKMYPEAPIYTSYCTDEWRQKLDGKVVTGYLQHWPFSKLRKFLPPLRGLWFARLDLGAYNLVISSSGAEAKFAKARPGATHIAYIHAPTHYYWSRYNDYMRHPGFGKLDPLARLGLKILVGPMRRWDYKAAQRPDLLIANSSYTKDEIKKYYGRDAVVIHPPVDIERFKGESAEPRRGFVTTGRQTPYKRIDLAVKACTELNLPLVVLGSGPDHRKLQRLAGKSITFLRGKNDEELAEYLKSSLAYIFPGVDDFGIAAVEALAAGTPVVAYAEGGALDYVNSRTGVLFKEQSVKSLTKALREFSSKSFSEADLKAQAWKFSSQEFSKNITRHINNYLV
jgi:glycosyltransferase involved in cell wall biosynthesis